MTYSLQMSLEFVPRVGSFSDSGVEGIVDGIELAPHGISAGSEASIDLTSQSL